MYCANGFALWGKIDMYERSIRDAANGERYQFQVNDRARREAGVEGVSR